MFPYNYIAIEGNIGAGKTSLATRLSDDYNGKLILEQFEENPFLPKFYEEPEKYAFPLEMSFLASRFHQLKDQLVSQDLFKNFTIADYYIVKSLLFSSQTLKGDEYALYNRLFHIITSFLPKPDLMVYLYLHIDKLIENIKKRGRDYERNINADYLDKIQKAYLDFIHKQKDMRILIVDTNHIDFVNNEDDYQKMVKLLTSEYALGVHHISL